MSNVTVPFEGKAKNKAILLLAAAEELGLEPSVVQTTDGAFTAPQEVVDKAFGEEKSSTDEEAPKPRKRAAKKAVKKSTESQE